MRDRLTTRRSFLAGAGAVAVAVTAGCQGDGDGTQGEDGPTTDDGNGGAPGTDEQQPRGELVVDETLSDSREWEFDLEEGETISVVASTTGTGRVEGEISEFETLGNLAEMDVVSDNPNMMQYTAENTATYVVEVDVFVDSPDTAEVEIYIASS